LTTLQTLAEQSELARRVETIRRGMARRKLDALIVFDRNNTYYLAGFRGSLSYLFITARDAVLLVDGRYYEATRETARHVEVRLMKDAETSFTAWARGRGLRRVGFEGSTAWSVQQRWAGYLTGVEWIESGVIIGEARIVKSKQEVAMIAASAKLNDAIYEQTLAGLRPGMTELDVRNAIRGAADAAGIEGLSFEAIVASGAMGSRPHYTPQARPLERGEFLLIDMGLRVQGYCSDMTRVVALGRKPRARLVRAFEVVLRAQQKALAAVGPGVACAELDRIAREQIKAGKFGNYFTHGLGHGVGLDIHEAPVLNAKSKDVLRPGMVVTVEPGVYLPGLGGIRIEDLVLVTRTGHRVLSSSVRKMRVVEF
jgi:Xaa-Pro aminopeptidase